MHFSPEHPDFELSPYTGLTRKHWIDAGKYILEGVFRHVNTMDDPVLVPRYETEVTYPNSRTPAWKVQAEYYEGLARSFFIADASVLFVCSAFAILNVLSNIIQHFACPSKIIEEAL